MPAARPASASWARRLGVHRFVTTKPVDDPVAETQRIAGAVLGYMTKMGVVVLHRGGDVGDPGDPLAQRRRQALAMNLVTDPARKALSRQLELADLSRASLTALTRAGMCGKNLPCRRIL